MAKWPPYDHWNIFISKVRTLISKIAVHILTAEWRYEQASRTSSLNFDHVAVLVLTFRYRAEWLCCQKPKKQQKTKQKSSRYLKSRHLWLIQILILSLSPLQKYGPQYFYFTPCFLNSKVSNQVPCPSLVAAMLTGAPAAKGKKKHGNGRIVKVK